ncbi:hypothetical protein O3P69_017331 [Scylla paramamosain]|uniref:Uncharacterized protein n=1 Tax=Scylla paramamosain TaxID=85552 RepID=A0AAW0TXB2_SCYPA
MTEDNRGNMSRGCWQGVEGKGDKKPQRPVTVTTITTRHHFSGPHCSGSDRCASDYSPKQLPADNTFISAYILFRVKRTLRVYEGLLSRLPLLTHTGTFVPSSLIPQPTPISRAARTTLLSDMSSQRYARALLSGAVALRNTARLQVSRRSHTCAHSRSLTLAAAARQQLGYEESVRPGE